MASRCLMIEIIPAILEKSYVEIENKISRVVGVAPVVQIDICDGVYTKETTWPYLSRPESGKSLNYEQHLTDMINQEAEMPHWEDVEFEIDCMVAEPKRLISDLLNIGPKRVIVHYGSLKDPIGEMHAIAQKVPALVELGIAVGVEDNLSNVCDLIDEKLLAFAQCMGIRTVGEQGTPLDESVLDKVCANIKTLREKYPDMPISVDGGVSLISAKRLVEAGATRLVSGSAIFHSEDPKAMIAQLARVI